MTKEKENHNRERSLKYIKDVHILPESINSIIIELISECDDWKEISETLRDIITSAGYVKRYINFSIIEDERIIEDLIKFDPGIITYIPGQPEHLCILSLEYANKDKTIYNSPDKIFRYSINSKNQTDRICEFAMSKCGIVLNRVVKQTDKICLIAVKQNGLALRFVKNKTDEICTAAIKQNPEAIKYIDNIEQNAYIEAVANKIKELHKYIKDNDQLIELEETLIRMILTMKK